MTRRRNSRTQPESCVTPQLSIRNRAVKWDLHPTAFERLCRGQQRRRADARRYRAGAPDAPGERGAREHRAGARPSGGEARGAGRRAERASPLGRGLLVRAGRPAPVVRGALGRHRRCSDASAACAALRGRRCVTGRGVLLRAGLLAVEREPVRLGARSLGQPARRLRLCAPVLDVSRRSVLPRRLGLPATRRWLEHPLRRMARARRRLRPPALLQPLC
jgi:hypothetical protein